MRYMRILLLVATIICLPPPSDALQVGFPQDTIAYNTLFNNRQTVAFDSHGALHISYTGQMGTNSATREIYYATAAGNTVITKQVTINSVDDNYSTLSIDRNDGVHIGFLGRDAGNLFQVQYARLIDSTFTQPRFITTGGLNKATPYSVVGPDSVVHFVYYTFTAGTDSVYYRSFDLRDSTLSPVRLLTAGETSGELDAAVAVDSGGFVHIAAKSGALGGGPLKYYTNRSGTLIETPTGVAGNVEYPKVLIDRQDIVHILYRATGSLILHVTDNSQGTFGTPVPITPAGQRPSGYNNFTVDHENRLYIIYQSSVTSSGRGFFLVHGRNSIFSDTILVFELSPDYLLRNSSAVAARGNGELALLYAPSASRGGTVVCDIFMQRGILQTTGVNYGEVLPVSSGIFQNYPNPFNASTRIEYVLGTPARVHLSIFDMLGREIAILEEGNREAGTHVAYWDGKDYSYHAAGTGVYFYRLAVRDRTLEVSTMLIGKMLLLR